MATKKNATAKRKSYAQVAPKKKPDKIPEGEISSVMSSFYNALQAYNPDDLVTKKGLDIYRKMAQDEQIKSALWTKIFAVLSSGWEIRAPKLSEGEEEIGDEMREFIEWNFNEMEGSFDSLLEERMTALTYGFACAEKIFWLIDYGKFTGKAGLKALKYRRPEWIDFETDPYGNLKPDGILQSARRLPVSKFSIFTYRKQFSNIYGDSDLRAAYRAWFIKDALLKYMSIGLERYGEPVANISHEGTITEAQRTALENFVKNLHSRSGLIHDSKITIKFESPTFRVETFIQALNLCDTHLRIAILMPGLMGMGAEQQVGSLARSGTEFNVFLWIVNRLRLDIETSINEQDIKPIIDLNYEVTGGEYPEFRFREIDREREAQVYDMWLAGITSGALKKFPEDENKQRVALGFAEKTEEELAPEPEPFGASEGDIFGELGGEEETDLEDQLTFMSDEQLAKIAGGEGRIDEEIVANWPEYFTCSYCGIKRYHLPGEHDQCDHSPTGECVDKEWEAKQEEKYKDVLSKGTTKNRLPKRLNIGDSIIVRLRSGRTLLGFVDFPEKAEDARTRSRIWTKTGAIEINKSDIALSKRLGGPAGKIRKGVVPIPK